jgi:hypothetical protein
LHRNYMEELNLTPDETFSYRSKSIMEVLCQDQKNLIALMGDMN